jgi:hypothetical protein
MEEIIEKLLIDFRNPVYPNGGVLTTEAQVKAALIAAFNAGRGERQLTVAERRSNGYL